MKVKSPAVTCEMVSPSMAKAWLDHVDPEHQRPVQEQAVQGYAAMMRNGQWALNHQGIAFDDAGRLMDGQHRLHAIIACGKAVPLMVSRGWTDNGVRIMDTIDRNRKRSIANAFHITHGIANANLAAAASRTIAAICCRFNVVGHSPDTALQIYQWFKPEILQAIALANGYNSSRKGYILGTLAFCWHPVPTLKNFVEQTITGEEVARNSPSAALRRYITQPKLGATVITRKVGLAAMHEACKTTAEVLRDSEIGLDYFRSKQPQIVRKIRELHGFID